MNTIKILSGGAANGLVTAVTADFTRATGLGIEGDFGAVGGMFDRIVAGEPVDIIILSQKLIDQLLQRQCIAATGIRPLGKVVTGLAVRDGQSAPDVSHPDALKSALLEADAIYVPDYEKSTAGIHFAGVLRQLGIFETVQARLKAFPNGQTAMAAMARATDSQPIGCTQMTEILNTDGVSYVGDLPPGLDLATVYTAAQSVNSTRGDAVQTLIDILASPEKAATRRAAGFQP